MCVPVARDVVFFCFGGGLVRVRCVLRLLVVFGFSALVGVVLAGLAVVLVGRVVRALQRFEELREAVPSRCSAASIVDGVSLNVTCTAVRRLPFTHTRCPSPWCDSPTYRPRCAAGLSLPAGREVFGVHTYALHPNSRARPRSGTLPVRCCSGDALLGREEEGSLLCSQTLCFNASAQNPAGHFVRCIMATASCMA